MRQIPALMGWLGTAPCDHGSVWTIVQRTDNSGQDAEKALLAADERGYKHAKAFVFDLRSSAFISGQPRLSLFRSSALCEDLERSDILCVPQRMGMSGTARPVIEVSGIRKTYGSTVAVSEVSFA